MGILTNILKENTKDREEILIQLEFDLYGLGFNSDDSNNIDEEPETTILYNDAKNTVEKIYLNGLRQMQGIGKDYILNCEGIVFEVGLDAGDIVTIDSTKTLII